MEKVLRFARALKRPAVLITPLIEAHYKNPDRLSRELVLHAFEKVVVPLKGRIIAVELGCGRPKIHLANLAPRSCMPANYHQKVLPAPCGLASSFRLDSFVISQRPALKNVVPGSDGQHRNRNLPIV